MTNGVLPNGNAEPFAPRLSTSGPNGGFDLSRGTIPIMLVIMIMGGSFAFGAWFRDLQSERATVSKTLKEHGDQLSLILDRLDGISHILGTKEAPRTAKRN